MKKALFLILVASSMTAQAQQKMIGRSLYYFDNTGATQYIDSSAYDYPNWQGSLFANEPVFGFDDPVFDWKYDLPLLHCGTETTYSGSSLPLTTTGLFNYTISGGNVTKRESSLDRTEYTYTLSGQTGSITRSYFDGSNWVQTQAETFEFDANDNMNVHNVYEFPSGSSVFMYTDSMSYNASNLLIESKKYNYDELSAQWAAYSKSILTYSGTEISTIQLFEGDISTPLEQTYHVDYTYTAGRPTKLEGFEVINGQIQTPALIVFDYTYGANQKIAMTEGTFSGDLMEKVEFFYDAQGFLIREQNSDLDFATSMLYVYSQNNYYYASTASVDENSLDVVTVYPNPVQDVLTIAATENVETVKIYSASGKIMIEQNSTAIDVSVLPAGAYIAHISTASGMSHARFVKN